MKKNIKLHSIVLVFATVCTAFVTINAVEKVDESRFLVTTTKDPSKRAQKADLKESVGQEIGNVLRQFNALSKSLGELQVKVASMQEELITKIDKIMENEAPFKKASKAQLKDAFKIVKDLNFAVSGQVMQVERLSQKMESNVCLKVTSVA